MRYSAFSSKTIISECAWIDFSRRPKIASLQAKVHAKNALSGRPFGRFSNLINKGQNSPESGTRGFSRPLITNIMFKLTSEVFLIQSNKVNQKSFWGVFWPAESKSGIGEHPNGTCCTETRARTSSPRVFLSRLPKPTRKS